MEADSLSHPLGLSESRKTPARDSAGSPTGAVFASRGWSPKGCGTQHYSGGQKKQLTAGATRPSGLGTKIGKDAPSTGLSISLNPRILLSSPESEAKC